MLRHHEREAGNNISAYLKQAMKAAIRLFNFMGPTGVTFPAQVVSLAANVAAYFTLSRVVPWAAIDIDLKPYLCPRCSVTDLHGFFVC